MKVLWATVFYPSSMFNIFLKDHVQTIADQTYQDFDLLIFLDSLQQDEFYSIKQKLSQIKLKNIILLGQASPILNPSEIRRELLNFAYRHNYDLIILSDFDETMDANRAEETIKQIKDFDFSFSSFYPVDQNLKRLTNIDFQKKCATPKVVQDIFPILRKNFIGLGNMSIKIKQSPIFRHLNFLNLKEIGAFDWLLATLMLLNNFRGIRIDQTFVNYRQYEESYIGIGHQLNRTNLKLGLNVKKSHYSALASLNTVFKNCLQEIEEVEKFIQKEVNCEKYIRIINYNFDPSLLCWWENIKTLKEVEQWI